MGQVKDDRELKRKMFVHLMSLSLACIVKRFAFPPSLPPKDSIKVEIIVVWGGFLRFW